MQQHGLSGHGHSAVPGDGIGGAPLRKEDVRLLTGQGTYTDDINLEKQAYAAFVRSPYPHARIVSIDNSAATEMPGVLCVLTGADAVASGIQLMKQAMMVPGPPNVQLVNRDGSALHLSPHPVLAVDAVRYVGQTVALVVAESQALAHDAADAVDVQYEDLPHVILAPDAAGPDAPK
eukprot:gene14569-17793_t